MSKAALMFGAAVFCLGAGQAMAQMSPADQTFATKAASGGQAEVSLGQLAIKNAASPQVRQFGQQMVTDHTQANQDLQAIARQQNLTLPDKPDAASHAKEQRLQASTGAAFDAAYARDMVEDHQQDIADFQKEAMSGKDPALKAFAQQYLPVLKQHLQMAQTLDKKS
jgi:putative membrane protein